MNLHDRRRWTSKLSFRLAVFLCAFMFVQTARAVSLHIGQSQMFTVDGPADGWITSSSWSSTCNALEITNYGEGVALVKPVYYFSGTATVECFYVYTYVQYDSKHRPHYHTGYTTKYFPVTCVTPTLTMQPSELTLQPGESAEVKAIVKSGGSVRESMVFWKTSGNSYVIDFADYNNGTTRTIIGRNPGTETITADIGGGLTATCTVTVGYKITPESISLPSNQTVKMGQIVTLKPTFTPSGAGSELTWKSSNPSVASVNSSGDVKGLSEGTTTITATTTNGLSASCFVTVYKPVPTSIMLTERNITLPIGDSKKLEFSVTPEDAIYTLSWKSNAPNIVSVDNTGNLTALAAGTASITVTTDNGLTDQCTVTAYKPVPTSIRLTERDISLPIGESKKLEFSVTPEDVIYTVSWKSNAPNIVSVDNTGNLTALAAGTASITVTTDNGLTDQCTVTVPPLPQRIYLPDMLTLAIHKSYQLECRVWPTDALSSYTWESSDTEVATVSADGLVESVSVGTADITVTTDNGLQASCLVVVPKPEFALLVWTVDNTEAFEFGFDEKPKVEVGEETVIVTSSQTSMEFEGKDIEKFTLKCINDMQEELVTGVGKTEQSKPIVDVANNELFVSGSRPGSLVGIYGIDGKLRQQQRTDSQGQLRLSLSGFGKGIYVIKTETTTIKVSKK